MFSLCSCEACKCQVSTPYSSSNFGDRSPHAERLQDLVNPSTRDFLNVQLQPSFWLELLGIVEEMFRLAHSPLSHGYVCLHHHHHLLQVQ